VDEVGTTSDCYHNQGKVTKEILRVGTSKTKPSLGSLCRISYVAYFYDKQIFDKNDCLDFYLGDIRYIEGLWRGVSEMRQGEKAKIRIKKKYGFGRPGEVEKLIFPPGFAEAGEKRDKITNKAVIYEVELLLFVKREDLEHNGSIFKQITCPSADKYEHEKPSCEWDEVTAEVAFCQERGDIFEPFNGEWMHKLDLVGPVKSIESPLVKRLIESMKRGEQAEFTVVAS
jgi:hypothetical protein